MVSDPIDTKPCHHKMSLQALGNFQLDRVQRRTGSLHVQPNRRLQSPLAFDTIDFDASTGNRQKRPNTVQNDVDLLLVQGWSFWHGLDHLLDFGNLFLQSSFQTHFHGLRRGGTGSTCSLQFQSNDGTIDFGNRNVSSVLNQKMSHFIENSFHVLPGEVEGSLVSWLFFGGGRGRAAGIAGIPSFKGRDNIGQLGISIGGACNARLGTAGKDRCEAKRRLCKERGQSKN
mmetsp:Transcript_16569/g.38082  ORF Transcript_16569/g.38082 Transcript_16569/m.38082 type:complete len:229 (+) Transcript_16569:383-1069(+)